MSEINKPDISKTLNSFVENTKTEFNRIEKEIVDVYAEFDVGFEFYYNHLKFQITKRYSWYRDCSHVLFEDYEYGDVLTDPDSLVMYECCTTSSKSNSCFGQVEIKHILKTKNEKS